ncbi:MAG: DedA family protein [Myxococcales bacterium]|nr:DedA family protein [Myxococcales bacterium]
MLETILDYLREGEGPLAYLILAASAAIEYLIPPFPGDTISLFGTFLAATAGYSAWLVYLALTAGSVGGGMLTWAFGRYVGRHRDRWPAFLRRPRVERGIDRIVALFERHGAAYLVLNRFVPVSRAFFFIAAGMSGMRPLPVAIWGGLSAGLWNALILLLGYSAGRRWDRLQQLSHEYALLSGLAFAIVVGVAWIWLRRHRHEEPEDPTRDTAPPPPPADR